MANIEHSVMPFLVRLSNLTISSIYDSLPLLSVKQDAHSVLVVASYRPLVGVHSEGLDVTKLLDDYFCLFKGW